jgi:hypothetical protein
LCLLSNSVFNWVQLPSTIIISYCLLL